MRAVGNVVLLTLRLGLVVLELIARSRWLSTGRHRIGRRALGVADTVAAHVCYRLLPGRRVRDPWQAAGLMVWLRITRRARRRVVDDLTRDIVAAVPSDG